MNDIFPKSLTVKQAVIATLAYFDLFSIPLTRAEISEHLFFATADERKIDIYLKESPLISFYDGYYSIKGDEKLYEEFKQKRKRTKEYWKKVNKYNFLFSFCPFIKLVAVCNSTPISNVDFKSDIDLLVITEKNKMFTARFFLTLFTSILGVRRHGNKTKKRFCLSFYISEDAMNFEDMAHKPYDIYLAYWLKTLEPVAGNYETYEELLLANENWLESYFRTITSKRRFFRRRSEEAEKWKERIEKLFASNAWENTFKKWQKNRAEEKYKLLSDQSGTIISDTILKFHDRDRRLDLRKDWAKKLNELL